jgi:hypothetical protein
MGAVPSPPQTGGQTIENLLGYRHLQIHPFTTNLLARI